MRPAQVVAVFAGLAAAFSFEGAFEDSAAKAVEGIEDVARLFRRQQTSDNTEATSSGTTARTTATGTNTNTRSNSGSNTASITGSRTGSARASGSASSNTTTPSPNINDPAGAVSMMTPDIFAGVQYYKVGDWVTLGWNYTDVQITPTAVNVIATCSQASAEWTIAANMSYEPSQAVYWDTNQYKDKQTPQLIVATYTLVIENADEAKATGTPEPGGFQSANGLTFGMYTPMPYVPFSDFTCPMCNSALSSKETQALGLMTAMVSLTLLLVAVL